MDSLTIRNTFLDFYVARGHQSIASAPLIPSDPTLLLNIAGMVPFKPFFLGDAVPPSPRVTSFQKCVRTNDIENVGHTTRHLTLFEMLGNFSFGDYFKRDAIRWAWELSTQVYGLDPERIWATIFETDDESEQLWLEETSITADRIQRLGVDDNYWWTHNAGPGGPCSELYYDRGEAWGEAGGPAVNDERYLEYYNLVFMQDQLDDDRNVLSPLPAQNVDTGLGLERLAVILQDVTDVFHTDWFVPLIQRAESLTGTAFGDSDAHDLSLRVLAEHARTSTFLIADGVLPSKEGRGYVLRRLLRRAVRHARLLGAEAPVMADMVDAVIATMGPAYPSLHDQRELVTSVASAEEADFGTSLAKGLEMAETAVTEAEGAGTGAFSGDVAFKLHDTHGFPVEITAEIAEDAGLQLDRDRFDELMEAQRQRARAASKDGDDGTDPTIYREAAALAGGVEFLGYDNVAADGLVAAIVTPGGLVESASEGDHVEVVLPRTPFYAEGGGQVGDRGSLVTSTGRMTVLDTQERIEGLSVHRCQVTAGEVRVGQDVRAEVDVDRRVATARSHSATHLLHATIKRHLGSHAQQAGSLVQPGRLRFDFPHLQAVSDEELRTIESDVNDQVLRNPDVMTQIMGIDEARAAGAVANFGDKYGQTVRVVSIGDYSKELCGGTHVPTGATIGSVIIIREESIGSNTRRVEALTGMDAHRHVTTERLVAEEVASLMGSRTNEAVERVQTLMARLKSAEKELAGIRSSQMASSAKDLAGAVERDEFGVAIVVQRMDGVSTDDLRQVAGELRGQLATRAVVVVAAATDDGKAQLVCSISDDLVDAGVQARDILQPGAQLVGGGAGGKGGQAQAGGRDGSQLDAALDAVRVEARTRTRDLG